MEPNRNAWRSLFFAGLLSVASASAVAHEVLPDGQSITPKAAPGATFISLNPGLADYPDFTAGQAVTTAVSLDGATLLVLTSGFNRNIDATGKVIPADSSEYVFVFDITSGRPVQKEVIQIPNTYSGIAFSPDGARFYVSGGKDDSVHTYAESGGSWAESGTPIALGHDHGNGLPQGSNTLPPAAAGLAVTADGKTIVVANYENDSISLVSTTTGTKSAELDLRPGKTELHKAGVPGGEFPCEGIKNQELRARPSRVTAFTRARKGCNTYRSLLYSLSVLSAHSTSATKSGGVTNRAFLP